MLGAEGKNWTHNMECNNKHYPVITFNNFLELKKMIFNWYLDKFHDTQLQLNLCWISFYKIEDQDLSLVLLC